MAKIETFVSVKGSGKTSLPESPIIDLLSWAVQGIWKRNHVAYNSCLRTIMGVWMMKWKGCRDVTIPFPYTSRKHHPIPNIFVPIQRSLHRSRWLWRRRSPHHLDLWNFHVLQCLLQIQNSPKIGQKSQEMWIRMRFEACQQIEISWMHLPARANLVSFIPRGSQPARIM